MVVWGDGERMRMLQAETEAKQLEQLAMYNAELKN